jgi:N-acetylneuraminate lyase
MMKFEGAIPALVTPFDPKGNVSEEMLRRLVEVHIKAGATGLYLCGGTGEGILLRTQERKQVLEIAASQNRKRIPLIVHVGCLSTEEAAELARHAEQAGADGVSAIPPFFYGVSTEGLYRHYARISENCKLPLILYNIPSLTGVNVTPEMMAKLMQIPTVTGIKFSSYNLYHLQQMTELGDGRLNLLSGNDEVFLGALGMGAHGSIGLNHNYACKLYLDIYHHFRAGHWLQAQEVQAYANRIVNVLLKFPPLPATKEIMRFKGYECGNCRGPLDVLKDQQKQDLHDQLAKLGFFEKELGL